MCRYWQSLLPDVSIVLAYGGSRENFNAIDWPEKVFVDDEALRTRDHQRECQSYTSVYRAAMQSLGDQSYDRIFFTEFDHVPLRPDYFSLLESTRHQAQADVLMHGLCRVNDTGHAHFLYHAEKPSFYEQIVGFSVREDKDVVLSAYGFGQYWTREAFELATQVDDRVGCYLELWAPTVAHHLGFRVIGVQDPLHCNDHYSEFSDRLKELKDGGAWSAHPVKHSWDEEAVN